MRRRKHLFRNISLLFAIVCICLIGKTETVQAQKIANKIYIDGVADWNYLGTQTNKVTGWFPLRWTANSQDIYDITSSDTRFPVSDGKRTNGITMPLRIWNSHSCDYNAKADSNHAEQFFIGRLHNGELIQNTFFYMHDDHDVNAKYITSAPNGYQLTNDFDQNYWICHNNPKTPSTLRDSTYKTKDFAWSSIYSRTRCKVIKQYNPTIGTVASLNDDPKEWGTTTALTAPIMYTYTVSYNLQDNEESKATIAAPSTNYKYVFQGFNSTISGYNGFSDPTLNGVYATDQGLYSATGYSKISAAHSPTTVDYRNVYGTLTIPAIAKAKVNKDNTSATFTAYYSRPQINLQIPRRIGYTFGGWYTNANFTGTKYTTSIPATGISTSPQNIAPLKSFTLYAKWIPNYYSIAYEYNAPTAYDGHSRLGEITHENKPTLAKCATWLSIANPTLKGYVFKE